MRFVIALGRRMPVFYRSSNWITGQISALSQIRLNEDFDLKHTTQITDMTNLAARQRKQSKRTATDLLQLPGILLTMTPSSDWDLLGHAICWISYKDQGWLTAFKRSSDLIQVLATGGFE